MENPDNEGYASIFAIIAMCVAVTLGGIGFAIGRATAHPQTFVLYTPESPDIELCSHDGEVWYRTRIERGDVFCPAPIYKGDTQ